MKFYEQTLKFFSWEDSMLSARSSRSCLLGVALSFAAILFAARLAGQDVYTIGFQQPTLDVDIDAPSFTVAVMLENTPEEVDGFSSRAS